MDGLLTKRGVVNCLTHLTSRRCVNCLTHLTSFLCTHILASWFDHPYTKSSVLSNTPTSCTLPYYYHTEYMVHSSCFKVVIYHFFSLTKTPKVRTQCMGKVTLVQSRWSTIVTSDEQWLGEHFGVIVDWLCLHSSLIVGSSQGSSCRNDKWMIRLNILQF